jgi:uncharacterized membrane protein YgdD (TMEM256/DUF423 family)
MMKSTHAILNIAALSGAVCVILASFGAHALEKVLDERAMEVFQIGIRYQMYHTLAMLAVAGLVQQDRYQKRVVIACWHWLTGIVVFSGSLYLLALTGMKWLGMITPIGGILLIAGWAALLSFRKNDPAPPL